MNNTISWPGREAAEAIHSCAALQFSQISSAFTYHVILEDACLHMYSQFPDIKIIYLIRQITMLSRGASAAPVLIVLSWTETHMLSSSFVCPNILASSLDSSAREG